MMTPSSEADSEGFSQHKLSTLLGDTCNVINKVLLGNTKVCMNYINAET